MDDELPEVVRRITTSFTHALDTTAEGLLDGLYLRGSLAWGEFHPGSDVDFTAVLHRRPNRHDLTALEAAHTQIWFEFPEVEFDGHHVLLDDLRQAPSQCPLVPTVHHGQFVAADRHDVDQVAWTELATRGVRVSGRQPTVLGIHDDRAALWRLTQETLAGYWGRAATELKLSWMVAGRRDDAVSFCTLGVARMHHMLATGRLTSKDGAGRYALEHFDERWHPLVTDALRVRSDPSSSTGYRSASQRGKDLRDLVAWVVADGAALEPPEGCR